MSASRDARLLSWLALRGLQVAPRETLARLLVSTIAVVVLLLGCALHPTALNRSARMAEGILPVVPLGEQVAGVRVRTDDDWFDGRPLRLVTLARIGDEGPTTHRGMPLPGPGEVVVSDAAAALLATDADLAARYPGKVVGEVPEGQLLGPRELVVWRYDDRIASDPSAGWLGQPANAQRHADVASNVPDEVAYALPLLAIGFLVPLLALTALLATLGAARRERRLAALRLVGLTDRQAKLSAAAEDGVLALVGVAFGVAAFLLGARTLAPRLPVEAGLWPADIALPHPLAELLLLALPLCAVVASWVGLRSVSTSPLGVERNSVVRHPRPWRVVPLVIGVIVLGACLAGAVPTASVRAPLLMAASGLIMVGLAGSLAFALRTLAGLAVDRTGSLPGLLVARRIGVNPARVARVSVGLTLLVTIAGPLLVFLPLIADVASPALARGAQHLGEHTLLASLPTSGGGTAAVPGATTVVLRTVDARLGPDQQVRVLVADCDALAAATPIDARRCREGLRLPGTRLDGQAATPVLERVGTDGRVESVPAGPAFRLPGRPGSAPALQVIDEVLGTGAVLLIDAARIPDLDPTPFPATLLAALPRAADVEAARTAILTTTGATALTLGERRAIATHTTREMQLAASLAAALIVLVAALATLVTAYEQVRDTASERRILAVAGAPRSLFRRALVLQATAPVALGVLPAAGLSLLLSLGFARLLTHTRIDLPVAALAGVAAIALVTPLLAALAVFQASPDPVHATGEQE